jgi:hypothetical protein
VSVSEFNVALLANFGTFLSNYSPAKMFHSIQSLLEKEDNGTEHKSAEEQIYENIDEIRQQELAIDEGNVEKILM